MSATSESLVPAGVRVYRGNPSDTELAVLTAVLLSMRGATPEPAEVVARAWRRRPSGDVGPRSWRSVR